ncbi:MAG: hypothetical protein LBE12_09190 [Planctomycetaceae bacterium]|jgi:hypothetical protein|nr:hypothetical protein [Planctomycetaceae bacterium]
MKECKNSVNNKQEIGQNLISYETDKKSKLNRRLFFKWSVLGGLVVLPVVSLVFNRYGLKTKHKLDISGDFSNYREYEMSEFNLLGSLTNVDLFKIRIEDTVEYDIIKVFYDYKNSLEPPRTVFLECEVIDKNNVILASANTTIEAVRPKISNLPQRNNRPIVPMFVAILNVHIPKNNLTNISSLVLSAIEYPFDISRD